MSCEDEGDQERTRESTGRTVLRIDCTHTLREEKLLLCAINMHYEQK